MNAHKEYCEIRILLGHHGSRLHRACEEMSSMSDSFQSKSSSAEGAVQYNVTMAIFSMGY